MTSSTVVFRRSARRDVQEARSWYEAQRAGLGEAFARSLDALIERIARDPGAAPQILEDVHRAHMTRFPYSVFYVVDARKVIVIGCMHQRRNPDRWPRRNG